MNDNVVSAPKSLQKLKWMATRRQVQQSCSSMVRSRDCHWVPRSVDRVKRYGVDCLDSTFQPRIIQKSCEMMSPGWLDLSDPSSRSMSGGNHDSTTRTVPQAMLQRTSFPRPCRLCCLKTSLGSTLSACCLLLLRPHFGASAHLPGFSTLPNDNKEITDTAVDRPNMTATPFLSQCFSKSWNCWSCQLASRWTQLKLRRKGLHVRRIGRFSNTQQHNQWASSNTSG